MQDCITKEERMSSLEIAKITGKPHNDVMKAIRAMEPAWRKIAQGNFSLGSYQDANNQFRPCYELSKTECLYIATKFNDEARAKLVFRWEELERERMARMQREMYMPEVICQMIKENQRVLLEVSQRYQISLSTIDEMKPKADYADKVLASESKLLTTIIAKDLGMSAKTLNVILHAKGILYKMNRTWLLYAPYQDKGLADMKTYKFSGNHTREQLVWTQKGRAFILDIIENGLSPKEALNHVNNELQPDASKQLTL